MNVPKNTDIEVSVTAILFDFLKSKARTETPTAITNNNIP
jgi:hypothetical protein